MRESSIVIPIIRKVFYKTRFVMKVGITYDLKTEYLIMGYSKEEAAEFDSEDTINAIESVLQGLSYETDRIGSIRSLTGRLVSGDRWDLVFNIAEGLYGLSREAQVPVLLDAYSIPYTFSDPLTLCIALHKGMAKRIVRSLGIDTPDFAVVEHGSEISKVRLPYPLFAKPVAEGTSKGIGPQSKITTPEELSSTCLELLELYQQPVLVETFLPGREFTVGIVGTGEEAAILGVLEIILNSHADQGIYSYRNKEQYKTLVEYRLANDTQAQRAAEVAMQVWKGLNCRDGGRVDLRMDGRGAMHFIEVNPLPGLHPVNSDLPILCGKLHIGYNELIGSIVRSALQRGVRKGSPADTALKS
jgi:D-alanine-D-alanine ligase